MDVFYEESAVAGRAVKEQKKYRILNIISGAFLAAWVIALIFIMYVDINLLLFYFLFMVLPLFCMWFFMLQWKKRLNISYDYVFVSGELRISKVFNVNKRKLITRLNCEQFLQMGDVDNSSFDRLRSDPATKTMIMTSNEAPAEGKFFLYILANDNGKKLYVLECRETLLVNILKFAPRSVLESDYVAQEKKQR